jgi:hypothetical protein
MGRRYAAQCRVHSCYLDIGMHLAYRAGMMTVTVVSRYRRNVYPSSLPVATMMRLIPFAIVAGFVLTFVIVWSI